MSVKYRTENDETDIKEAHMLVKVSNIFLGIIGVIGVSVVTITFAIGGAYTIHYLVSLAENF